jgi:organic radical activating enzyme
MVRSTGPAAAIAGIVPGVQSQGVWTGRRQLFVRFAGEAETAVLYTAEMLIRQLVRAVERSPFHSISLSGHDPLANAELIVELFDRWRPPIPVMIDCDGQRPETIPLVTRGVTMIQVTCSFDDGPASLERAVASLVRAAAAEREHAVVLSPHDGTSDGQILRFVEQTHAAAPGTKIVVHPALGANRASVDERYAGLLEQAMAIHHDTVLLMRVPGPVGAR